MRNNDPFFHKDPWSTPDDSWNYKKSPNPNINNQYKYNKDKDIVTIYSLFPNLDRYAVGVRDTFNLLESLSKNKTNNYPPCNITKYDDKYEIELALAGFSKSDIKITVDDRTLVVESNLPDEEDVKVGTEIHRGIAQRDFKHTFALGQWVEVVSAGMENGILTIKLDTVIPDDKKPKSIEIG